MTYYWDGSSYLRCDNGAYNLPPVHLYGRSWEEPGEPIPDCAQWDNCYPEGGSCAENPGSCSGGSDQSWSIWNDPPPEGIDPLWWKYLNEAERTLCQSHEWRCFKAMSEGLTAQGWARIQTPALGTAEDGNLRDALRHARWQAGLTKYVSEAYARQWGDAHESMDSPTSPLSCMDQFNNQAGRVVGGAGGDINSGVLNAWQEGRLRTEPQGCP